jgi:hypothetical protein
MIEFKRKSVKEVFVSELIQDDIENFLYTCRISNISNAIWTNGIIILIFPAHATEKIVERQFDGCRIYDQVVFVKYPKYAKTVKWNGGIFELALRNYTNHSRFREFAKWIKLQPEWSIVPEKTS